jgi:hypothetical protein
MQSIVIPLIQKLYLVADRIEVPENRVVPISISDSGKILKAKLFEKSHDYFFIHSIFWEETRIVKGIFIYHFYEILNGFVTNKLRLDQEHLIWDKEYGDGIKLYYGKGKEPDLCFEIYDIRSKSFVPVHNFTKIECCILVALLKHYMHKGEIKEEPLQGNVKCNYGRQSFMLKSPEL